jgi:hypothetical protein
VSRNSKVIKLRQMCSITNTAHARSPPATRTEEARGAGQRSRMDCDVYLLSAGIAWYLPIYVHREHCNQGEKCFSSVLRQFGCTPHPLKYQDKIRQGYIEGTL